MNLLVGIKSIQAWQELIKQSSKRPRLALPYAFAAAFYNRNHKIFAINYSNAANPSGPVKPFEHIYQPNELLQALRNVDMALLWGGRGTSAILRQVLLSRPRRRVILVSYIWKLSTLPTLRAVISGTVNQISARFSKAVMVMTDEQLVLAKQMLPSRIPVIRFICGIDTSFHKIKSNYSDVPEIHHSSIDKLLYKPYVIVLGDQQRCNENVIKLVRRSDINLVRVCRDKKTVFWFNEEIQRLGLNDRLFVFRDINYTFLRFLLQHSSAYAGLVNSKWQPAGWTVACEALASGLPVVMYDGLVYREMRKMGVEDRIVRSVPFGDISAFQSELELLISQNSSAIAGLAKDFVFSKLDIEDTSRHFVEEIESLC